MCNSIEEAAKRIKDCALVLGLNEFPENTSWEEIDKSVYFLKVYSTKVSRPDVVEMLWAAGLSL